MFAALSLQVALLLVEPDPWIKHPIKRGESLSAIFKQYDLTPSLLHKIISSSEAASSLAKIRPGQTVHFGMREDQELEKLVLERDRISSLHIGLSDADIVSEEQNRALEKKIKTTTNTIKSSLFVDGQAAGLSDKLIMQLAKVFGWDIDFALEVMPGDSFSLVYEERYLDGEKFSDGPILAAEFVNQGKTFRAVQYTNKEGITSTSATSIVPPVSRNGHSCAPPSNSPASAHVSRASAGTRCSKNGALTRVWTMRRPQAPRSKQPARGKLCSGARKAATAT